MKIFWITEGDWDNAPTRHRVYIYNKELKKNSIKNLFQIKRFSYRSFRNKTSENIFLVIHNRILSRILSSFITEIGRFVYAFYHFLNTLLNTFRADSIIYQRSFPNRIQFLFQRVLRKRVFFDFDDAIYLKKPIPDQKKEWKEDEKDEVMENKIINFIKHCSGVIVSNEYLKSWAIRYNTNTVIIPTSVKIDNQFLCLYKEKDEVIIGWIGAPENQKYLMQIYPAIQTIVKNHSNVYLHIITSNHWKFPDDKVRLLPWSLDTYQERIQEMSIALAPLNDSPWTQGKMQFKAIQCAAQGVPVVASPIGFDTTHWIHNENIMLASSIDDFKICIAQLIENPDLRRRIGMAGLDTVRKKYTAEINAPKLKAFIKQGNLKIV